MRLSSARCAIRCFAKRRIGCSRLDQFEAQERERSGLNALIGESQAVVKMKAEIRQVAATGHTTVLIVGETGTGKELVARAVHSESDRAAGPFIPVNCSAIPDKLFESAFFGHKKGAFTDAKADQQGYFELAHGGTLFLDEIGDMPLEMQVRLLRMLEERCIRPVGSSSEIAVDVRVVAATNRVLTAAVEEGNFREDLYYRLNVFTILHIMLCQSVVLRRMQSAVLSPALFGDVPCARRHRDRSGSED